MLLKHDKMIELIILDKDGTFVGLDHGKMVLRRGFPEFIGRYANRRIVVATFGEEYEDFFSSQGVCFDRVYNFRDMIQVEGYRGLRKDVKRICLELQVAPTQAVFISDDARDYEDARREGVKFIHVPSFWSVDEPFSFEQVDVDQGEEYIDLRHINPKLSELSWKRVQGVEQT